MNIIENIVETIHRPKAGDVSYRPEKIRQGFLVVMFAVAFYLTIIGVVDILFHPVIGLIIVCESVNIIIITALYPVFKKLL